MVITVLRTRTTRHIIKIDGEPDADAREAIEDMITCSENIDDAVSDIQAEYDYVIDWDEDGELEESQLEVIKTGASEATNETLVTGY